MEGRRFEKEQAVGTPVTVDAPRTLSEHVVELSTRLKRIIIATAIVGLVLSIIPVDTRYYVPLISYFPNKLISFILPEQITWHGRVIEVHIAQYNPFAGFNILLKTGLLLGLLGASPIIMREFYAYISPALYPKEKRALKNYTVVGLGLFSVGVLAAVFIVMPVAFRFMIITSSAIVGDTTLAAFSDVEQLFSTIVLIAIATGVAFETPLLVYLLVSLRIVDSKWFTSDNKKFILIGSLVLGAAISPDPSGIGMLVIGLAMYSSILFAAGLGAKKAESNNIVENG